MTAWLRPKQRRFLGVVSTLIVAAYPIVVYLVLTHLNHMGPGAIPIVFAVLGSVLLLLKNPGGATLLVLSVVALLLGSSTPLLYYPVIVNGVLLALFLSSLFKPPTVIERFARLGKTPLPEEGVRYCRSVTKWWCAFFLCNGGVSLWTVVMGDLKVWSVYNGGISYLLIGVMFGVEYLIRQRVQRRVL
jgi:uncharacterized membrane protein